MRFQEPFSSLGYDDATSALSSSQSLRLRCS